ncbi:MAG TPA: family 10 glycosylhydrolase [Usitatibacter sp.]|nr:family 10 glycosylhydrolase [Usitatibacter sp.]
MSSRAAATLAMALALAIACTPVPAPEAPPGATGPPPFEEPPPAPREFRAAWVAVVANIDWPSRRDLAPAQQRAEMLSILDRARAMNLNAIILQVRPSADAIYPSAIEPWSEYLTNEQGRAPHPAWDPLAAWVEEAHARGIELHAWFNPYRARHNKAQSPLAPGHVARTHPQVVKSYGEYLWMDPGEPVAAQRTLDVILDVVRRYDIDGVHIDDYFYPYPEKVAGTTDVEIDFPDGPSWRAYQASGGTLARADWRRQNVNALIERIHDAVRREKRWVRFGVSPFGLGRPDRRPVGIAGFSQYDKLYADVELWMRKCWMDYLAPQLYWPRAQAPQAFGVLLDYWIAQNACGRHLFPGLFTSRIDASAQSWAPGEIVAQVAEVRRRPGSAGHIHFSMAALAQNRAGIADALAAEYAQPALVPASPWIDASPPAAPDVAVNVMPGGRVEIEAGARGDKPVASWAVWTRAGNEWRFTSFPRGQARMMLRPVGAAAIDRVVVSAVDRLGNESRRVALELVPTARTTAP